MALRGRWCNIIILIGMQELRRKVKIPKTVLMRNSNRISIIFLFTM